MFFVKFLYPFLLVVASSGLTYLLARKKNKVDVQGKKIKNKRDEVELYQGMVDDLTRRFELALEEIKELETRYKGLEKKYKGLIKTNRELIAELRKYKQLNGKKK